MSHILITPRGVTRNNRRWGDDLQKALRNKGFRSRLPRTRHPLPQFRAVFLPLDTPTAGTLGPPTGDLGGGPREVNASAERRLADAEAHGGTGSAPVARLQRGEDLAAGLGGVGASERE